MNLKKGVLIGSATLLVLTGGVYLGTKIGDSSTKENLKVASKVEEKKDIDLLEKVKKGKDFELTFDYFKESTDVNFKIDGKKSNKLILETKENNLKLVDSESEEVLSELNTNAREVSDPQKAKYEFKNSDTTFKLNDLSKLDKNSENIDIGYFEEGKNKFDLNISNMTGNSFEIKEFEDKEFEQRINFDFDLVNSKNYIFKGKNQIYSFNDEYKGVMNLEKSENSNFNIFDLILFEISGYSSSTQEKPKSEVSEKESENTDTTDIAFNSEYNIAENGKTNTEATSINDLSSYQHLMFKEGDGFYVISGSNVTKALHYNAATEEYIMLNARDRSIKFSRGYNQKYTNDMLKENGYDDYAEYQINGTSTLDYSVLIITKKDNEIIATINPQNGTTLANRLDNPILKITTHGYNNALDKKDISLAFNPTESEDKPYILIESELKNTENPTYILANEDSYPGRSYVINNTDVDLDLQFAIIGAITAIDSTYFNNDK